MSATMIAARECLRARKSGHKATAAFFLRIYLTRKG